jgi:hypothetical protein
MSSHVPHHVHAKLLLPAVLIGLISSFAFVAFFTSALHDPQPNRLAVAVVAGPEVASNVQRSLDQALPGGFDVKRYGGEAAARTALAHQEVDGAFVPSNAPRLLLAGGAGANAATALRTAFGAAAGVQGRHLDVEDVAPLPKHDSRGLSAFFTVAGTSVGSLLFAVALFFLGGHAGHVALRLRLAVIAAFAVAAGLVVAIDTDFVVDGLSGAFWGVAGIGALLAATVALLTTAVVRWFGAPGIGLCVLALMLFSLPASGGAVGPEFVPDFYRVVAPVLPSHAALLALRGTVYFDGGGTTTPILILMAWAGGAVLSILVAHAVRRDPPRMPVLNRTALAGGAAA